MKSRIPHTKSADSQDKRPQQSRGDSSTVHASLKLLGAPHLEDEEFFRLYRGSLADVLLFVSEHMKGRRQVALARAEIHQLRELRSKSHLRQPHDTTRSAAEKASSSLSGGRQTAEMYRRQMNDRQTGLDKFLPEAQIVDSKAKLRQTQQVNLLLDILEQKERLSMRRFQEMTGMLGDLRKAVEETKIQFTAPDFPQPSRLLGPRSLSYIPRPLRVSHTRNTLSTIYAYHARLSRIAKRQHGLSSELMKRLRKNIARQSGRPETDPETARIVNEYISVARRRGTQMIKNQNHRLGAHSPISKADLEDTILQLGGKEQELQQLSDLSVALGFLCEHFISSISIFLERTSHVFRSSLQEEAPLAKAHIDVLRCLITSSPSGKSNRQPFTQAVMDICKMRGGTPDAVIEQVERLITNAHRQRLFLDSSTTPSLPSSTLGHDSLTGEHIDACYIRNIGKHMVSAVTYASDTRSAQERAVKLLTRKVEKADLGYSLVKDIEALLQETRIIVGQGSK